MHRCGAVNKLLDPPANLPGAYEELPLRTVPQHEWDSKVAHADEVMRLIDRHLDFEAKGRLLFAWEDFQPEHLCPEQRVEMVTDICVAASQSR